MALMQAGAVDYVPKSVLSPELVARSVRSAVRFQQVQREKEAALKALSRLNAFLCESQAMEAGSDEQGSAEYFVVLTLAVVESATGRTQIAVAGSEPPILLHSDGTFEEVAVNGMPLGVAAKAKYQGKDLCLEANDMLLVATDGITEARRGREFLGNEGMARLAADALPLGSLAEIGQAVLAGAKSFANDRLHDDVCLLLARRK